MRPLLARLPILHSRDLEEARAFLAARAIALDPSGPARSHSRFEVRYNGAYLPRMWLGYIAYGTPVALRPSTVRGDYWVHCPIEGGFTSERAGERIDCDARRGLVASPTRSHVIKSVPGAARLSLQLHGDALQRHLALLLGAPVERALEFDLALALDAGAGRSLAGLLRYAAAELGRGADSTWGGRVAAEFEELAMTQLLYGQPHTHSVALRRRERPMAPRDVKRALDYIHENVREPIGLADLVAVAGVAGRTLLKHFRDFQGVSPMRYVRRLRLEGVRNELARGGDEPVTAVALRWGFEHAGRFAVEYRRAYGETPSATRARSRAH
jgi:AraC-like DNA-binding protein